MVMEVYAIRGEELGMEEEVLKRMLNEWRHLDERFIPEDQKNLHKENF